MRRSALLPLLLIALALGVGACGGNVFRGGINAGNIAPHARQRFTQQPRSAPDVERIFAG